jgi:predicted transcriptional regulator
VDLRIRRTKLGISQTRLARLARVSRFKICMSELDNQELTADEEARINEALRAEVARVLDDLREVGAGRSAGLERT